jgi:hypothetical protein
MIMTIADFSELSHANPSQSITDHDTNKNGGPLYFCLLPSSSISSFLDSGS